MKICFSDLAIVISCVAAKVYKDLRIEGIDYGEPRN